MEMFRIAAKHSQLLVGVVCQGIWADAELRSWPGGGDIRSVSAFLDLGAPVPELGIAGSRKIFACF
jgi:hypothetical protein